MRIFIDIVVTMIALAAIIMYGTEHRALKTEHGYYVLTSQYLNGCNQQALEFIEQRDQAIRTTKEAIKQRDEATRELEQANVMQIICNLPSNKDLTPTDILYEGEIQQKLKSLK